EVPRARHGVAVRGAVPRPPLAGRADHHEDRRVRAHGRPPERAARPRHADRPELAVLVRPPARDLQHRLSGGGLRPRQVAGAGARRPGQGRGLRGRPLRRGHGGSESLMPTWLTQEWMDEQTRLAADQPERPGASARMQYVITGGPDGEIRYYWVLEDGHLRENRLGTIDDAE